MRKTTFWILIATAVTALSACGGDDDSSRSGRRISNKSQVLENEDRNAVSGGGAGQGSGVTAQDRQLRARAKLLKSQLGAAADSDSRAEILGNVMILGEHGKSLWSDVIACFKDEEPFTRGMVLQTAAAIDPSKCQGLLLKGLVDEEAEVRQMAAEAWGKASIKELAPLLDKVRDELEGPVQFAIMKAVEDLGEPHHTLRVVEVLDDLGSNALKPAIRFLAEKGGSDQAERIAGFLERNDMDVRILAARTLAGLKRKTKPILRGLVTTLTDEEVPVRQAGIDALKALTGQDLGYDPEASEEARTNARAAWRTWIDRN